MNGPHTISLIGFSGTGKSTLGPILAHALGADFFDTDAMIEEEEGRPVSDIFYQNGEAYFRRLESQVIRRVIEEHTGAKVIAVGGGAFENKRNRELIRHAGLVVHLSCSIREIYKRTSGNSSRPMLGTRPPGGSTPREARMERIRQLMAARKDNYDLAEIRVATSGKTVYACAQELHEKVGKFFARDNSRTR